MTFRNLLQFVTPQRRILFMVVALLLLESTVSLTQPWLAGLLTRAVLEDHPAYPAGLILLVWLGLLLATSLIGFASHYLIGSTGESMAAGLRQRLVDQQLGLRMSDFQARQPGDLLALLSNDAGIISNFITQTLVQVLPQMLTFAGAWLMIAWLDPAVALLAGLLLPVYGLAIAGMGRKIRPLATAWINAWSAMIARAEENLGLLPAIKAFTREHLESERFSILNTRLLRLAKHQLFIQSALTPAMSLLAGTGLLALLWFGSRQLAAGRLQTHELVSLILYAVLMARPLAALAGVYGQIMQTRGAAGRLLEFFTLDPESGTIASAIHSSGFQGDIEFRDICFAYPGKPPLLEHFNLHIAAGETIALNGPNGAGKSTLAHLLIRFLEPSSGKILLDGRDIQSLEPAHLRRNIALVAQQTLLQDATVAENIAWGLPGAAPEAIKAAARAAGADVFINALPQQYATPIGHQGHSLSGGQRQRLALARVLLKNPPVVILDEATAMLDRQAEWGFFASCRKLLNRQTVVIISHHPAGREISDRVLQIERGKLVGDTSSQNCTDVGM